MKRKGFVTVLATAALLVAAGCGQANSVPAEDAVEATEIAPLEDATSEPAPVEAAEETETIPLESDEAEGEETASASLPAYVYPEDDPYLSAICAYLTTDAASDYEKAEVSIPVVRVVDVDDSDELDVLVWGDFAIYNYNLEGTILTTQSGGSYPGLMHLAKNTDGSYNVTAFELVTDGSDYDASAKEIFGDRYEDFSKLSSDNTDREKVRAEYIQGYVDANGLDITAYQDFGWDPVELAAAN